VHRRLTGIFSTLGLNVVNIQSNGYSSCWRRRLKSKHSAGVLSLSYVCIVPMVVRYTVTIGILNSSIATNSFFAVLLIASRIVKSCVCKQTAHVYQSINQFIKSKGPNGHRVKYMTRNDARHIINTYKHIHIHMNCLLDPSGRSIRLSVNYRRCRPTDHMILLDCVVR